MSDLVAIAYEDLPTAQRVASNLDEAVKGHEIELGRHHCRCCTPAGPAHARHVGRPASR